MIKRRRQNQSWFQKYKKYIYIGGGAFGLGIVSFVLTIIIAGNTNVEPQLDDIPQNYYAYKKDESSIRINPESLKTAGVELKKDSDESITPDEAIIEDNKKEKKVVKIEEKEKAVKVSVTPIKKEVSFIMPIDGEIIAEYAKEKLIYSKTLEEWITHNGIDIKAEEAMPIKASADGKVKDKKVDPRYGNTIIIEHDDGYKTVYSNLSTLDLVNVGQEIRQGDIISGVGAGYGFEVEEGAHIHWEVMKDNSYIDPIEFSD